MQKRFQIFHACRKFESGLSIPFSSQKALVEFEREISVHCEQIRHIWNDFRPTFLSKILRVEILAFVNSSNFWILLILVTPSVRSRSPNSSWSRACSRLDCSYPVGVCPISTACDSNCLFNSYNFQEDHLCIHISGSRILVLWANFSSTFQLWSWSDSWLTLD